MLNDSTHPQVTVYGKLVESAASAEAEHQVYHYHVNILKPGQEPQQDYDRELHLCHTNQTPVPADKALNTSPNINIDDQLAQAQTVNKPTIVDNKDEPASPLIPEQITNKPSPKQMAERVCRLINNLSKPALKSLPRRNIFAGTNWQQPGKSGLLAALVLAVALMFYFIPDQAKTISPTSHPSTGSRPAEVAGPKQDYHAVIKQNTDGITIMIKGPDHAETLTKLPPGYHPVIAGNKIIHIVTPGNTLWFIAKRYIRNPYRYPELARLNKIKNPDLIYPGDRVIIQNIRKP